MKRTRHTAEPIIRKLNTAEQLIAQGKTVVDVCRVLEVTQPTYHRWRQQYGGMQAEEARRLTQLEKAMLKDLAEGTFRTQNSAGGRQGSAGALPGIRIQNSTWAWKKQRRSSAAWRTGREVRRWPPCPDRPG